MDRVCMSSHFRPSGEADNGPRTFEVGALAASVVRMRVQMGGKVDHGFKLDGSALFGAMGAHVGSLFDRVGHGPDVGVLLELVHQRRNGAVVVKEGAGAV